MNRVATIATKTYKSKLLTLIHDVINDGRDLTDSINEINAFSETRCQEEYEKIQNFLGFSEQLSDFIEEGNDLSNLDEMPLIKEQQEEQDFFVAEKSQENAVQRRAQFKLV